MTPMKCQLKVVKTDGSTEEYLHTKVLGTISNALACVGQADTDTAEELAEVVTYFLYHKKQSRFITAGEIFSMIKVVLTATNYEDAALELNERHFGRKLKRSRIEVVPIDINELADAEMLANDGEWLDRSRWDKSAIVTDLIANYELDRHTARTVASMVEEKILNMDITLIPASLIKQLVLNETAAILHARRQLQTV